MKSKPTPLLMLGVTGYGFALFGLVIALGIHSPLAPLVTLFLDLAHFPLDGAQVITTETEHLLLAIAGGLCVGLGVVIILITPLMDPTITSPGAQPLKKLLLIAALAWYIPDSLGSFLSGAWFNVLLNSGFLAMVLVPIRQIKN